MENENNCYNCRLFIKGQEHGEYKSDFCKYKKIYLNYNHSVCKYYTDINGPSRNFREELGKGHSGKRIATFED